MLFDNGRAQRTPLFDQLLGAAKDHHAGLIFADTLADVFPGNENDRGQSRLFGQSALGHLARETGAAVIALAHPSLTGSANGKTGSGSTAWRGTVRSQLYLESPETEDGAPADPDIRILRRAKANYARRDEIIEVRWQNGVFIPEYASTGIIGAIGRKTCERVFLELLDKLTEEGRYVSENSRAGNYAPKIFAMQPDRERFTKKDFEPAMQALFTAKKIKLGNYRKSGHDHDCIVKA